jgi:hypothetical protein
MKGQYQKYKDCINNWRDNHRDELNDYHREYNRANYNEKFRASRIRRYQYQTEAKRLRNILLD